MKQFFLSSRVSQPLVSFISGALMVLAFAPFQFWIFAPLCLAWLFRTWVYGSARQNFITGYSFGLGLFGFGLFWIRVSIDQFGNVGTTFAVAITLGFAAFMALFPALSGWLLGRYATTSAMRRLLYFAPAVWLLSEWVRHWLFTGFPWLTVGYSQIDTVLVAYAPVGGVLLVSFVLAVVSGALALLSLKGVPRAPALVALAAVIVLAGALQFVAWSSPIGVPLRVSLLQGNIEQADKWKPEMLQPTLKLYTELTEKNWDSDLIVWPETAVPAFFHTMREDFLLPLAYRARENNSEILLGIPIMNVETRQYYNAMMSLGQVPDFYYKQHLVPFGEFLPLSGFLGPILRWMEIPMSDFSLAPDTKNIIQLAGYPAGISICYEDAFGNEIRRALPRAAFLVNASNDAWFGDSLAPQQHLEMARMRAVETSRYLLRATNTGVSAIIDSQGGLLKIAPQFQQAVLTAEIIPLEGQTPYAWLGNILALLVAIIALYLGWREKLFLRARR